MEFELNKKIFNKLPLEVIDIIMSLYYAPLDIDTYYKRLSLQFFIKQYNNFAKKFIDQLSKL